MKMNKVLLWGLILIPVGIGGYFLYRFFKNPAGGNNIDLDKLRALQPAKAISPSVFPLQNGSRNDLVTQLQGLIGVTTDGIFGPKTQAALLAKTGKTKIASQEEFDQVIIDLKNKAIAAAGASRAVAIATTLYNDWQKNASYKVRVTTSFTITPFKEDIYGNLIKNGPSKTLPAGTIFKANELTMTGVTTEGWIKVVRGSGTSLLLAVGQVYLFYPQYITLQA